MTIELGVGITILLAIVGGTKWISSALATLATKIDGVQPRVVKLEETVVEHGERLARLEPRPR